MRCRDFFPRRDFGRYLLSRPVVAGVLSSRRQTWGSRGRSELESNQNGTPAKRSAFRVRAFDRARNRSAGPAFRGADRHAGFQPPRLPLFFQAPLAQEYVDNARAAADAAATECT